VAPIAAQFCTDLTKEHFLSEAIGIIKGPAGAPWSYRSVTSILASLRREFKQRFTVETNTPVLQISKGDHVYEVRTSRGIIRSRHVVYCTNGDAAHLLPELLGRVSPVRGQMSAQALPHGLLD
jgi:glycine/D-amino acid oxidase-like deaminating enzyme